MQQNKYYYTKHYYLFKMGRSKRAKTKNKEKYSEMAKAKTQNRLKKREEKRQLKQPTNNNMEKRFLVGFYGDYRKSTVEHRDISRKGMDTLFVGSYYTEPEYSLYKIDIDMISALVKGDHSILVEVFSVTQSVLETLDLFNGFDEGNIFPETNYFTRHCVGSPFGEIFIYFWEGTITESDVLVKDGDWVDFLQTITEKKTTLGEHYTDILSKKNITT